MESTDKSEEFFAALMTVNIDTRCPNCGSLEMASPEYSKYYKAYVWLIHCVCGTNPFPSSIGGSYHKGIFIAGHRLPGEVGEPRWM